MEPKIVDARGKACPMPVIDTKKVLESIKDGIITTIVDNEPARDNVITLAKNMACEVEVEHKGNEYHVRITKKHASGSEEKPSEKKTVLYIPSTELGRGSSELGAILMKSLMVTLYEGANLPNTIIFVNTGVYLACEGSPVLDHLLELQDRGVKILACGTCLDFFKIQDKLRVGNVSNMYSIYETLAKADKVISL